MTLKRTMCAILAASMLTAGVVSVQSSASAAEAKETSGAATDAQASGDYGLASSIPEGNILHCFDWTFNDIKDELPNIAAAGFTSVQTSPIQGQSDPGAWYWLYQPTHLGLQANSLGGRDELTALCAEADKYGIKIVVDVVANHLAGAHGKIDQSLVDSQYWHNSGLNSDNGNVDWTNRWQITHCDLGMPDFNSEHEEIQKRALAYANDLKGCGVDGIRWDAAKHIGLPSEDTHFWDTVSGCGLWMYGEILDGPLSFDENNQGAVQHAAGLMNEYCQYISVTDSKYGDVVTGSVSGGSVPDGYGVWAARGVSDKKLVYWGESHDTYSNKNGWTKNIDQNVIDRAYAIVASRNNTPALYLSRPFAKAENDIQGGQKGSTHFSDKEVAEINKFKNANRGKADYYTAGGGCAVITRKDGGAVIVKGSGSGHVDVPNGGKYAKTGTFKDAVSGNSFTVTESTISGDIGNTGIAVIYDSSSVPTPDTDTSSHDTDTSVTPPTPSDSVKVYFDNSSYNWSTVNAYVYADKSEKAAWPGTQMTKEGDYYVLDVTGFENGNVIFTESKDATTNRYPADMEPGLEIGGKSHIFKANHVWEVVPDKVETDTSKPDTDTSKPETDTSKPETDTSKPDTDTSTPAKVKVLVGDANQDGKVSLRDASFALKATVGKATFSGNGEKAADVDGDGSVTAGDSLAIQRYDIGIASNSIGEKKEV